LLGAVYPAGRINVLSHYLAYTVAVFVTVSGFHYAVVVARRLHAS
jgi:hypothetical protein